MHGKDAVKQTRKVLTKLLKQDTMLHFRAACFSVLQIMFYVMWSCAHGQFSVKMWIFACSAGFCSPFKVQEGSGSRLAAQASINYSRNLPMRIIPGR